MCFDESNKYKIFVKCANTINDDFSSYCYYLKVKLQVLKYVMLQLKCTYGMIYELHV